MMRNAISLVLSDKEAIVFHMMYDIGASAVKGESLQHFARIVNNARNFVDNKMTLAERNTIKKKMTELGAAIDPEVLQALNIMRLDQ
jgi:hypothetical protein